MSEIFPLEVRAMAIEVFFSIAQCFGALGPVLYGWLIGDGSDPTMLLYGYLLAAGVMIIGGVVEVFLGVDAENKALEDVAEPLSLRGTGATEPPQADRSERNPPRPAGVEHMKTVGQGASHCHEGPARRTRRRFSGLSADICWSPDHDSGAQWVAKTSTTGLVNVLAFRVAAQPSKGQRY